MQEDTRADTIGCPWCDSFPGKGQAKPRPQSAVRRVSPGSRGAAKPSSSKIRTRHPCCALPLVNFCDGNY